MRLPPSRSRVGVDVCGGRLCIRICLKGLHSTDEGSSGAEKVALRREKRRLLPLVESQQFVGCGIDAVHVPMRCQSDGPEATTKTTTTTTRTFSSSSFTSCAASPPFHCRYECADITSKRAKLRKTAAPRRAPCARTSVGCCYSCYLVHSRGGAQDDDEDDGAQRLCRRSRCIYSAVPTPLCLSFPSLPHSPTPT